MDDEDVRTITNYLTAGVYPNGMTRDDKRSLRQKSRCYVCHMDGTLYHRGKEGRHQTIITESTEKQRIMLAVHTGPNARRVNAHIGMNTMIQKISEKYWWRRLVEDVRIFCKSCTSCGQLSTKFIEAHPMNSVEKSNCIKESVPEMIVADLTEMFSDSYHLDLITSLQKLQVNQIGCDVMLSAGAFQMAAHKVLLIAASRYLKSLILDADLPITDCISLSNVTGACLEAIILFIYTGRLKVSSGNVNALFATAELFEIQSAVELCRTFINDTSKLSAETQHSIEGEPVKIEWLGLSTTNFLSESSETNMIGDTNCGNVNRVDVNSHGTKKRCHIQEEEVKSRMRGRSLKLKTYLTRRLRLADQLITIENETPIHKLIKHKVNPRTIERSFSTISLELASKSFNAKNSSVTYLAEKSDDIEVKSRLNIYRCFACSRRFNVRARLIIHCSREHLVRDKSTLKLLAHQLLTKAKLFSLRYKKERQTNISNKPQSSQSCRKIVKCKIRFSRRNNDYKWSAKRPRVNDRPRANDKRSKSNFPDSVEAALLISNKCGWCGQSFGNRSELVAHRKIVHCRKQAKTRVLSIRQVQRNWSCLEKTCNNVSFKTKDKLRRHMAEAHPTVLYTCPHCRFKTQVEQFLKRHLMHRHNEQHVCTLCGKGYDKPFLLRFHMFSHHKISDPLLNIYHCDHEGCDYATPSRNSMNLHVLKHTSGNPFCCDICKKSFKREIGLQKHTRKLHLNIRPYICDKCGTCYADNADLRTHMNLHAEQKPYKCDVCSYSSYTKASLRSHKFSRHQVTDAEMQIMQCDVCSFSTHKRCQFQDHIKVHQSIRDIPCAFCTKLFITKKALNQHIVKYHQNVLVDSGYPCKRPSIKLRI